jgi:hypothetical protein
LLGADALGQVGMRVAHEGKFGVRSLDFGPWTL